MKKILALILALCMFFTLASCGDDEQEAPIEEAPVKEEAPIEEAPVKEEAEKTAKEKKEITVKEYFDKNGEAFLSSMTESFDATSGGKGCKGYLEVEGNGVIVDICIAGLNDLPDDLKAQFQDAYDTVGTSFDSVLALLQTEVPALERMTINICEEDRDVLAVIKVGK